MRYLLQQMVLQEHDWCVLWADEASASWTAADGGAADVPACHTHIWCGRKQAHIAALPSGAVHHIAVEVMLTSEGMHELNDFQLRWKCSVLQLSGTCHGKPHFIRISSQP